MIRFIHSDPRFERRLNDLRRSERFAVAAAKKADKIIDNLIRRGEASIIETGKLSRYGEARIPNCVKYDLGKGYRLVCVKRTDHLFLLYIGTHDDCHKWIEDNRSLIPDMDQKNIITRAAYNACLSGKKAEHDNGKEPDYDELLMTKITEKDLRWIFQGLCGNRGAALRR